MSVADRSPSSASGARTARLLLLLLSLAWGFNWPMTRIALAEVTPWTLRLVGYGIGMVFMFALVRLRGRDLALPAGPTRIHVVMSALLSVVGFGMFSAFAQLSASTSRVVIVAYSMPVWASLLGWPLLGQRLNAATTLGVLLCLGGLAVLIYPVAAVGIPVGLLLALGAALSWAAGTLYLNWARIKGDGITITAWQLLISFVIIVVCVAVLEGWPHLWPLSWPAVVALAYHGIIGTGIAYFLWFDIVGRLPAATASLGTLFVPVIGILSAVFVLGERPSAMDALGFALIFAAAASVLLQPFLSSSRTGA
jgi:drug/metabolite transporter (DMT)-like permease